METPTTFQFPFFIRLVGIIGLIFFSALAAGGIFLVAFVSDRNAPIAGIPSMVVGGVLAFYSWKIIQISGDRVVAEEAGIRLLPAKRPSMFIRWDEVASVESSEISKCLIITDGSGSRKIRLEYQLENFDKLRELVLRRTEQRRRRAPIQTVFHRDYVTSSVMLVFFLVFAALVLFGLRAGVGRSTPLFVGAAAMVGYAIAREPRKVTISALSVRVSYVGWHRTLYFRDIANIEIVTVRGKAVGTAVLMTTTARRPVVLMGFRGGTVALFDSLHRAWLMTRNPTEATAPPASYEQANAHFTPAPQYRVGSASRVVFRGKTWFVLFPAALVLFFLTSGFWSWHRDKLRWDGPGFVMAGLYLVGVAAGVYLLKIAPRQLTIGDRFIRIEFLWRKHDVQYAEIADIILKKGRTPDGASADLITLSLRSGGSFRFGGFGEDSPELYDVLRATWLRSRNER